MPLNRLVPMRFSRRILGLVFLLRFFTCGISSFAEESAEQVSGPGASSCTKAGENLTSALRLSDGSVSEESLYREALKLCPRMAEAYYNLGVLYSKRGDWPHAKEAFENALKRREEPSSAIGLGRTELALGDFTASQRSYEMALVLEPDNLAAIQGSAIAFEKAGEMERALSSQKRAVEVAPDNPLAHFNLAVLYEHRKLIDDALKEYLEAFRLDNQNFYAALHAGMIMLRAGRLAESEQMLRKATDLKARSQDDAAEAFKGLGDLYRRLGDAEKSEFALKRAIELDEQDSNSMINLAVLSLESGRIESAESYAKRALQAAPTNVQARHVLGWAQMELGRLADAKSSFEEALRQDGSNAVVHYSLGVLYRRQGFGAEAKREFEIAQNLNPQVEAQFSEKSFWSLWVE